MDHQKRVLAAGRTLASLAMGFGLACAAQSADMPSETDWVLVRLAGIENIAAPYPWLLTGGQPDSAALATLAEAGVHDVMNLRTAAEPAPFDERALAKRLGLKYLPIPTGATDFSDARFTAFRHHLIAHGPKKPLFVHCASGNRVGAALLPWLVLDQGVEEDEALRIAQRMGLRDPDLTRTAREYIRAHH